MSLHFFSRILGELWHSRFYLIFFFVKNREIEWDENKSILLRNLVMKEIREFCEFEHSRFSLVRFHDFFANFLSQKITLIFHSVFFSNYCILAFIPFVFTIFCEPNLNSQKIVKTNGMKARVYCYET